MVDTTPWVSVPADVPAGGNFTVTYRAVPVVFPDETALPGRTLELDLDYAAARSPYVTATAVLGFPSTSTLPYLDPTAYDLRLRVYLGYKRIATGQEESYLVATLRVSDVTLDYLQQTVTLRATSDEAILNAQAALTARPYTTASTYDDAIRQLIGDAFPGDTLTFTGGATRPFTAADTVYIGDDLYDAVTEYADALRVEVRHDGAGTWVLAQPVTVPGPVDATLRTGPRGDITALRVIRDRPASLTDVIVRWDYAAAGSAIAQYGYGAATTARTPRSMVTVDRKRRPQDPGATAATLLARGLRRGQRVEVEALPKFWLRPYDTVIVSTPQGQLRAIVERVRFTPHRGVMTLEAQHPLRDAQTRITITHSTPAATP